MLGLVGVWHSRDLWPSYSPAGAGSETDLVLMQNLFSLCQTRLVDHLLIHRDYANARRLCSFIGFNNPPSPAHFVILGGESAMRSRDLAWVNQCLPGEPHLFGASRFFKKTLLVVEIDEHRVDGVELIGSGMDGNHRARKGSLFPGSSPAYANIRAIVFRSESHANCPRAGSCEVPGANDSQRSFNDQQQFDLSWRNSFFLLDPGNFLVDRPQFSRIIRFG